MRALYFALIGIAMAVVDRGMITWLAILVVVVLLAFVKATPTNSEALGR